MKNIQKFFVSSIVVLFLWLWTFTNVFALSTTEQSQYNTKIDNILTNFDAKLESMWMNNSSKISKFKKIQVTIKKLLSSKTLNSKNKEILVLLDEKISKHISSLEDNEINIESFFTLDWNTETQDKTNNTSISNDFPKWLWNLPWNTTNNNRWTVTSDAQYFYYTIKWSNIYKMKKDGSDVKEVYHGNARFLNTSWDWIYFSSSDGWQLKTNYIYKIKKDGTQKTQLTPNWIWWTDIILSWDWIYFIRKDSFFQNQYVIYKMKTDWSNLSVVKDFTTTKGYSLLIYKDYLYFKSLDMKYYRVKTDGTDYKMINEDIVTYADINSEGIFYVNQTKDIWGNWIYKMNFDWSWEKLITSGDLWIIQTINVVWDWIYYTTKKNSTKIYKMKTDGTQIQQVSSYWAYMVNIIWDWIFYAKASEDITDQSPRRVRIDGTWDEKLDSLWDL